MDSDTLYSKSSEYIELFSKRLIVQRYAISTQKSYIHCLKTFLYDFRNYALAHISETQIENHIKYLIDKRQISLSY